MLSSNVDQRDINMELGQRCSPCSVAPAPQNVAEQVQDGSGRKTLVETMTHRVFIKDRNLVYLSCNGSYAQDLKIQPEEIAGKTDYQLYPGELARKYEAEDRRVIESGRSESLMETHVRHGQERVFLAYRAPITDEAGNVIGILGILHDVTERERAEGRLRDSEIKYRILVERLREGVYQADIEGNYLFLNTAGARILGFDSPDQVVGKYQTTDFYCDPQERAEVAEELKATGSYEGEVRGKCSDGRLIWMLVNNNVVRDEKGDVAGFEGTFADVTRRKMTEEGLRESEERYRALFESMPDAVVVTSLKGKVLDCNPVILANTGYTREEFLQLSLGDLLDQDFYARLKRDLARRNGDTLTVESQFRQKSGRVVPVEIVSRKMRLKGQLAVLSLVRDISGRKRAEDEQQRIEKLESVGILAGGIAHDFNNLLTGITGNISLAVMDVQEGDAGRAVGRLQEAERASMQARSLTQQLLTFATGGAPVKKPTSIAELVRESATFALRGSAVKCGFSLPDGLWAVEADEGQINQVVQNIIINAAHAMPQGGVIKVSAVNAMVHAGALLLPRGRYVKIVIQDQGIGIPREHLARIFDPYFTTKQKGSGLGLTIAHSIVNKHGGHISIESELGKGTTVRFYLPATKKRLLKRREEDGIQRAMVGRGRVLVMDDQEVVQDVLRDMLRFVGYEVKITHDGVEAMEEYSKARESGEPFDVVILDLTVPGGMGGKETLRRLREIDPGVRAIVSSGYATDPIMSDYASYGFSAVVAKPYSLHELDKTLRGLLDNNCR